MGIIGSCFRDEDNRNLWANIVISDGPISILNSPVFKNIKKTLICNKCYNRLTRDPYKYELHRGFYTPSKKCANCWKISSDHNIVFLNDLKLIGYNFSVKD